MNFSADYDELLADCQKNNLVKALLLMQRALSLNSSINAEQKQVKLLSVSFFYNSVTKSALSFIDFIQIRVVSSLSRRRQFFLPLSSGIRLWIIMMSFLNTAIRAQFWLASIVLPSVSTAFILFKKSHLYQYLGIHNSFHNFHRFVLQIWWWPRQESYLTDCFNSFSFHCWLSNRRCVANVFLKNGWNTID